MHERYKRSVVFTKLLSLPLLGSLLIAPLAQASSVELIPTKQWRQKLLTNAQQQPAMMAAQQALNSAQFQQQAADQPVYNPELELSYEDESSSQTSDQNYTIGINQTIDLWDKRGAASDQAFQQQLAKQSLQDDQLQQHLGNTLKALVKVNNQQRIQQLASQQESHLKQLADLLTQRQAVGDVSAIESELAFLGLSQTLNQSAVAAAELKFAQAELQSLTELPLADLQVPAAFWQSNNPELTDRQLEQQLDQHPQLLAAQAQWRADQYKAQWVKRSNKADPTIGFSGGKQGDADSFGISLSIPLNVRNSYSASAQAANSQANEAEALYLAKRKSLGFAIQGSSRALEQIKSRYTYWQTLNSQRIKRSATLLEKEWKSGELSTTEYLIALQQRNDSLISAQTLEAQYQTATIDWLLASGQLLNYIEQL